MGEGKQGKLDLENLSRRFYWKNSAESNEKMDSRVRAQIQIFLSPIFCAPVPQIQFNGSAIALNYGDCRKNTEKQDGFAEAHNMRFHYVKMYM